jgi:periplasmic protein TonB
MHAVQMRAASLGMSALLLGAALMAALTMKYVVDSLPPPDNGPVIVSETLAPPPVDPPLQRPRPDRPIEEIAGTPTDLAPPLIDLDPPSVGDAGPPWTPPMLTVTHPHWLQRPSDLARYYPRRALDAGVEGQVVLDCLVGTNGRLSCAVASETPARWGFGAAALAMARDHQMEPAMRDGVPVEARYQMRVPFNLN